MLYFKSKDGGLHPFTLKINSLVPKVELEFVQTDKDVLLPNVEISKFVNEEILQKMTSTNLKVNLIFRRTKAVIDELMMEAELKDRKEKKLR